MKIYNKKTILLSLLVLLSLNVFAQKDKEQYELIFEDDFTKPYIDTNKWQVSSGVLKDATFLFEKAILKQENIVVKEGILNIISKRDTTLNQTFDTIKRDFFFSTGKIISKQMFPIGVKIEAKIKLPKAQGLWSAFWLYGQQDGSYNELDIFETNTNKKAITTNMYYDASGDYNKAISNFKKSYIKLFFMGYTWKYITSHFCVYTVVWDKDEIRFLIDGKEFRTVKAKNNKSSYPVSPMSVILNTAVLPHDYEKPKDDSLLPDRMQVDYIKVYQKK
ncbi:MAG: glycoside hydrolase family 16 protein [Bacteroidales bacterium]|jgi:beta-glucanase (GH16 family)|nr:glycoside hydrolase family 16 protein [Bacteroidales bacterium]